MNKEPEKKETPGRFGPFSESKAEMTPTEVEEFKKQFPHLVKEWEKLGEQAKDFEEKE